MDSGDGTQISRLIQQAPFYSLAVLSALNILLYKRKFVSGLATCAANGRCAGTFDSLLARGFSQTLWSGFGPLHIPHRFCLKTKEECGKYCRMGSSVLFEIPGGPAAESGWVFLELELIGS